MKKKCITMFLITLIVGMLGVTTVSNSTQASEMTSDVGLVFSGTEKQAPAPTPAPPDEEPIPPKKIARLPQTGEKTSTLGVIGGVLLIAVVVGCFLKFSKKESDAT